MRDSTAKILIALALTTILVTGNNWLLQTYKAFSDIPFEGARHSADFFAYYTAGASFDINLNPYHDNGDYNISLSDSRGGGMSKFIYPPAALPIYKELSKLPYYDARKIWMILGFVFLAGGILALCLLLPRQDRLAMLCAAMLITVLSKPLIYHVRQGQIDAIISGIVYIAFAFYCSRQRAISALLIAIGTLFKINPLALMLFFIVYKRDGKFGAYYLGWMAVLLGISFIWLSPSLYTYYFKTVFPAVVAGSPYYMNQSITKWFLWIGALGKLPALAMTTYVLWLFWKAGKNKRQYLECQRQLDLYLFTLNIVFLLLCSSITWHSAYVWMIAPSAFFLTQAASKSKPVEFAMLGFAVLLTQAVIHNAPVINSLNTFGGGLFFAILVTWSLREIRQTASLAVTSS